MDVPLLIALVLSIAAAGLVAKRVPAARRLLTTDSNREPQIDGLRGICAVLVALHHIAYLSYWNVQIWTLPVQDRLAATAGKVGVGLFFLICAYLFWSRLAVIGSSPRSWVVFLGNRVRRIVPMYVVAMTAALALLGLLPVAIDKWWPAVELFDQGLRAYTFWFMPPHGFNDQVLVVAALGVAWTLKYEWLFYASLPLVRVSGVERCWPVLLPALVICNEVVLRIPWVAYFAYGCMIRELVTIGRIRKLARSRWSSLLSLLLVLLTGWHADENGMGLGWPALALSVAFLPIAAGADWFGVLRSEGARLVGIASYSVYLVNFIVAAQFVPVLTRDPATTTVPVLALGMAAVCSVTIWLSLLTYRFVERPFQRSRASAAA